MFHRAWNLTRASPKKYQRDAYGSWKGLSSYALTGGVARASKCGFTPAESVVVFEDAGDGNNTAAFVASPRRSILAPSFAKTLQRHKSRPVTMLQARPHAIHFNRILDFGEGQAPCDGERRMAVGKCARRLWLECVTATRWKLPMT